MQLLLLGQKRVLQQLTGRVSGRRVNDEHFADETLCVVRNMLWKSELASSNLFIQLLVVLALERELTAQHRVEEDATSPDVSRRTKVLSFHADLWTHVGGSSTEHFELDIR